MIQRISLVLLLPLLAVSLDVFTLPVREAAAQNAGQRRDEDDEAGNRGEGRGGRGGRGRGRGQFGGGGADGGNRFGGGGGERSGGAEGGGRNFVRRGGGEGENPRGPARGSESQGGERSQRPNGSASSNNSDRRSGGAGSSLDMEEYVRKVVKENDKDGDMMLNAEEQRGLSGKAATADLNKDGKITTNELATALSPATAAAAGGDANASPGEESENGGRGDRRRGRERIGGDGERPRGSANGATNTPTRVYTALSTGGKGVAGKTEDTESPRTYRFKRGADRLPATGLPSWFKSRDKNGDGQVEMSEYSGSWSDRTVGEFRRYDRDNDGIVTSKEAAGK